MKTRSIALVLVLFLLAGMAGVFLRQRSPAPPAHVAPIETAETLREGIVNLPPEEQERRERQLVAEYAKESLIGARDWDGKTDGLYPEQFPEPDATGERPAFALWKGPGDTGPDGTIGSKTASAETHAETTSTIQPGVKPTHVKPLDPVDDGPRRKASPETLKK